MNVSVAFSLALDKTFDYILPPALEGAAKEGLRVKAPFGKSLRTGVLVKLDTKPKLPKGVRLKEIAEIIDEEVYFGPDLFALADFLCASYANTLGQALDALLPDIISPKIFAADSKKAAKKTEEEELSLPLFYGEGALSEKQKSAVETAKENNAVLFFDDFRLPLSQGALLAALNFAFEVFCGGAQVLILTPDVVSSSSAIALVKQKFRGQNIYMWHGKVPVSEKKRAAAALLKGEPCVIIGAPSASLLPFKNLGLVIMLDEEDKIYKREDMRPYYHARDVILLRAALLKAKAILISKTPSAETLFLAQEGKIKCFDFNDYGPKQPSDITASARVQIILEHKSSKWSRFYCQNLLETLRQNFLSGKKALLIINRLGFSGAYSCLNCGALLKCPKCGGVLRCSEGNKDIMACKCGYKTSLSSQKCSVCANEIWRPLSGGTQGAFDDIKKLLPQAKVCRLDSQTFEGSQNGAFKEADIIIGTNLALNADFENGKIGLCAVLDADMELNRPDFRASERFAQMIFSLKNLLLSSGGGKLFVQSAQGPELDVAWLKDDNYLNFAREELALRKEFNYPPYVKLVKILLTSKNQKELESSCELISKTIEEIYGSSVQAEGCASSYGLSRFSKEKQKYILVKVKDENILSGFIKTLKASSSSKTQVKIIADPYFF